MLSPGDRIERYEVVQVLGEGGMAVVYRVRHTTLASDHALKLLTLHSTAVRDRLLKEGQAQARLRHPNVVAVHDILEIKESPALLMEYVDGPTLRAWLKVHQPPLDDALAVFGGILAGVRRAHELGLVHRDLKPANVLMATIDGVIVPKVADFGLVKAVEDGDGSHTRTGVGMGTPAFMAPEQFRDAKSVDHRADIFSLGCILYALVCGEPPYEGTDLFQLMTDINAARYVPPNTRVTGLPGPVAAAIAGALEPDRNKRIPDCTTLAAVLSGERDWPPAPAAPADTLDYFSLDDVQPSGIPEASGASLAGQPLAAAGGGPLDGTGHGPATAFSPVAPDVRAGDDTPPSLAPPEPTVLPVAPAAAEARRTSPLAWVALGALLIMGIAGAASWMGRSARGPGSGVAGAPTPEAGAPEGPAVPAPAVADPPPAEAAPRTSAPSPATAVSAPAATAPTEEAPPEAAPTGKDAGAGDAPGDAPPPEDEAAAVAPSTGTVSVNGGGLVKLHVATGSFRAGEVPPGDYTIRATFGGTSASDAGTVRIEAGQTVRLTCNSLTRKCQPG